MGSEAGPPRHLHQAPRWPTGGGSEGSLLAEGPCGVTAHLVGRGRPRGPCGSELLERLLLSSSVSQSDVLATGAGDRELRDPWGGCCLTALLPWS